MGDLRPDTAREPFRGPDGLFRAAFERAATGLAILDTDCCFLETNPALERLLGCGGDELRRLGLYDFVHPEDREKLRTASGGMRTGNATQFRAELRLIRRGWELRWCRVAASLLPGPAGDRPLIVAALEDVTERRLSERSFRASVQAFRDLVDKAAAGVATTDPDGNLTFVNEALCRLSGYSEEELLGRRFPEFIPPGDLERALVTAQDILHGGRDGPAFEFRFVRKDGRVVHCITSPTALVDDGVVTGYSAIIQDITTRVIAQEELDRLAAVVRASDELVALGTIDGRLVYLNEAGMRLTGLRPEDIGRVELSRVLPPDMKRRISEEVLPCVAAGRPWEGELEYRNVADGRQVIVNARIFPLPGARGGPPPLLAHVSLDVTRRRLAEAELVKLSTAVRLVRECILMLDPAGKVTFSNVAASELLGWAVPPAGRDFAGALHPPDRRKWQLLLEETARRGSVHDVDLTVAGRGGRLVPMEVSTTLMPAPDGGAAGIVVILRDVTERRNTQRQMRGRLMSYRLEEGTVYLVKEAAPVLSLEAFRDLLRAGYRGTVLSRTPPRRLAREPEAQFGCIWFSERGHPDSLPPRPESILQWLESLPPNHAVLVDRLDYLISRNGHRSALGLVQRLGEAAYLMGHIVILSLDPATQDPRRLRAFEKETSEMQQRSAPSLPPELMEVLRYVYQRSILGERPSLTEMGEALGLSKPTARKRARLASRGGYIALNTSGRTKTLELTEKGRGVFLK